MTSQGICYLVGAGPGDPGLITCKGLDCIRRADVLYYDQLAAPDLVKESPEGCELVYVGKKAGNHALPQEDINRHLCNQVRAGKVVVRLKGGDPFVFGRGGEEALALADEHLPFVIIPGVTAGVAAAAYAGIPVTQRGVATSVTLITGHESPDKPESTIDWPSLGQINGTLCFYMGVKNLPMIVNNLIAHGRDPETPIALVEQGTTVHQITATGTLTTIVESVKQTGIKPPAMIIVGEVVALRNQLNWFETLPLFGQTILVTRSRAQASSQVSALQKLGAKTLELPAIRIEPMENRSPLTQALQNLKGDKAPDWVIFTSVNGVEAAWNRLDELKLDSRSFGWVKIAAIGIATAQALMNHGIRADLVPTRFVAEALFESLQEDLGDSLAGQRFLLLRADIARAHLREQLEGAGAVVDEVSAYQTVAEEHCDPTVRDALLGEKVNVVTFASSSTVSNFAALLGDDLQALLLQENRPRFISIGPVTSSTMKELNIPIDGEAEVHSIQGMIDVLR